MKVGLTDGRKRRCQERDAREGQAGWGKMHMQRPRSRKACGLVFGLVWAQCRNSQGKEGKVAGAVHKGPEFQEKALG